MLKHLSTRPPYLEYAGASTGLTAATDTGIYELLSLEYYMRGTFPHKTLAFPVLLFSLKVLGSMEVGPQSVALSRQQKSHKICNLLIIDLRAEIKEK